MSIKSLKSMKNRSNSKKKEETAQGVDNRGAELTAGESPSLRAPSNTANNGGGKFMDKEPLENCVRRVVAHLQAPRDNTFIF